MKDFALLFAQLDQTTSTNAKVEALAAYFRRAGDRDKLWTIAVLSHRRPKRTVNTTLLREWASELAGVPFWLFEESYHVVGDLAETIALVLPPPERRSERSFAEWVDYIKSLGDLDEAGRREGIFSAWQQLDRVERFVFNKLITGGFRLGVSQKLMVRALSRATGIEENTLAHRLMGNWTPDSTTFETLVLAEDPLEDVSRPYPFYLAYPLETDLHELGAVADWLAERKWDGIRGQVIVREGTVFVWSRGEELLTDKFPEFGVLAEMLPSGVVLDGEIMPFRDGLPLAFNDLQTRIGRKNVTKAILKKTPVVLFAYDLLEVEGRDIRGLPFAERRRQLEALLAGLPTGAPLLLSELVPFDDWAALQRERALSRQRHSEGLMLKRKDSAYRAGRKRGDWWKWKVDPMVIDAVMIYAQRGHGRRANLYTDFTFAVWDNDRLVPFTKAYSGLTDQEFQEITTWVNKNTVERFGPVRSVHPRHVFEIAFEGIQRSGRHKSGVALRFPRMNRWRKDKPPEEANTLADLRAMLEVYGNN